MTIEHELVQVNGVGDATLNKLVAGGIETITQLAEADTNAIVEMGFTSAQAGKIIAEANKVEEAGGPKPDMEVWFKMYKKTLRPEKEVERSTKDFSIIRTALAVGKRTEAFVEYL